MQLLLLQKALDIHRRHAPESLMPFQAHMDQSFHKMREFVEKEYRIQLTDSDCARLTESFSPSPSPKKRIQTMPPQNFTILESPSKSPKSMILNSLRAQSVISPSSTLPRRQSPTKVYTRTESSISTTSNLSTATVKDGDEGSEGEITLPRSALTSRASTTSVMTLKSSRNTIELDQTLTTARPPRPPSRPSSAHFPKSPSPYGSVDTPSVFTISMDIDIEDPVEDADYDIPPPLPEKKSAVDRESSTPDSLLRSSSHNSHSSNYAELSSPTEPPPMVPKKTYKESTC